MKLYFIHCGFYDEEISDGIYEFHLNIPVVASDLEAAKTKVRQNPAFIQKKMHIDGIQELRKIDGYELIVQRSPSLSDGHEISNICYRDL